MKKKGKIEIKTKCNAPSSLSTNDLFCFATPHCNGFRWPKAKPHNLKSYCFSITLRTHSDSSKRNALVHLACSISSTLCKSRRSHNASLRTRASHRSSTTCDTCPCRIQFHTYLIGFVLVCSEFDFLVFLCLIFWVCA